MKILNKNIIVFALILLIVFLLLVGGTYYYFSPKDYKTYINDDIEKIEMVELTMYECDENPLYIYDEKTINEILDIIEGVKAWPVGSGGMGDYALNMEFVGADNRKMNFGIVNCGEYYGLSFFTSKDGIYEEGNIWNALTHLNISKEDGDRIYEAVHKLYLDNYKDISPEKIKEFSKKENIDWREFQQFRHKKVKDGEIIKIEELITKRPHRLNIEGKKGYLMVWFAERIKNDIVEGDISSYSDIIMVKVFNELGESIDLYDESLDIFLEEME